jgi:hypothetical protein
MAQVSREEGEEQAPLSILLKQIRLQDTVEGREGRERGRLTNGNK